MKKTLKLRLLITILAIAMITGLYHFGLRPTLLDWRTPYELQQMPLPGDNFSAGDYHTRAILVTATPDEIWPWIMQLGQDRGGFYSYQWLENLAGAKMHNVFAPKKELQSPRYQGDTIWLASKENYKGQGYQIIAKLIPERAFVMVSGADYQRIRRGESASGSWGIYLVPMDPDHTYIVARSSGGHVTTFQKVMYYVFFEIPHFIMEEKMLRTMKTLAENNKSKNA